MEKVYENIKKLRIERGLSQEELAKRTGYTDRSSIAKIESGKVDLTNSKIAEFARALGIDPSDLMGWKTKNTRLPNNISIPAAYPVPILGTIGCGEGPIGEQNFDGFFYIDHTIRADYALHTKGDSMIDAGIQDGDVAFLVKDFNFEEGQIYAVVFGPDNEAVLKKVYKSGNKVILQSCNTKYPPIILDESDMRIIGKLSWICHRAQ